MPNFVHGRMCFQVLNLFSDVAFCTLAVADVFSDVKFLILADSDVFGCQILNIRRYESDAEITC